MPNDDDDSQSNALAHMLIDAGLATEEQLEQVYEEQERSGVPFTDSLYNFGIIQEHELLQIIADNLGTEFVDLKTVSPPPDLVERIPANIVRMYNILPIYEEDEILYVVAVEPMNFRMIDELPYVIGQEVIVRVARPDEIMNAIEHFYPEGMNDSMTDLIAEMHHFEDDFDEEDDADVEELMNSTPIVRFVNVILYQAVKDLASDIHFEPFADEFKIRYRIDGALYEMTPPPKHLANPVISRVKVISGLDIAERRLPQDGRIQLRVAGRKIDLRVSTLPTQYGESVVLRVLDKTVVSLDIDALGLPDQIRDDLRTLIAKPNGIILVTGPTGSGKTTTLYSCLKEINSIEDFKGLKMRIPGLGGKVISKAGGSAVLSAGGEIYTNLERGVIDATEWIGPFHDKLMGFHKAARYYYYPGWHEPGTEFELLINMARWSQLPDDLKKIVEIAAAANSDWIYISMEYHNSQALLELKEKKNIEVLEFPAEVMAELRKMTSLTLNEEAEKNPKFKRIYNEYKKFQDAYAQWSEMTEAAYQRSKAD